MPYRGHRGESPMGQAQPSRCRAQQKNEGKCVFIGGQSGRFHCCLLSLGHSQGKARRESAQSLFVGMLRYQGKCEVFKIYSTARLMAPAPPHTKIQKIHNKERNQILPQKKNQGKTKEDSKRGKEEQKSYKTEKTMNKWD